MLPSEQERVAELAGGFCDSWSVEAGADRFVMKHSDGDLELRLFNIGMRYDEFYARVLVFDYSVEENEPLFRTSTNISNDLKINDTILAPLADILVQRHGDQERIKHVVSQVLSVLKSVSHALHAQADEARQASEIEELVAHTGEESLDTETWPFREQEEVIPGFAVAQTYTILFGDAGVGKSILAHNLGLQAAAGVRHLLEELRWEPAAVLYLSLEMGENAFRTRHNILLCQFSELARSNFHFSCPSSFDFTNPRDRSLLVNLVRRIGARVVIVDGHSFWIGDRDRNDNSAMANDIVTPMLKIAKEDDVAFVLLHHSGWGDKGRITGAKVLYDNCEACFQLERDPTADNLTTLTCKKWRPITRPWPKSVTYSYDPETCLMTKSKDVMVSRLQLPAKHSDVVGQICLLTDVGERQAKRKVKNMVAEGHLQRDGRGLYHSTAADVEALAKIG